MKKKFVLIIILSIVVGMHVNVSAQITTTVPPPCVITVSPSQTTIYSWEKIQFSATLNGACNSPCYTWEISLQESTGSSISANGLYTPGSTSGIDIVRVTDTCNNNISDTATITINLPVPPSPPPPPPPGMYEIAYDTEPYDAQWGPLLNSDLGITVRVKFTPDADNQLVSEARIKWDSYWGGNNQFEIHIVDADTGMTKKTPVLTEPDPRGWKIYDIRGLGFRTDGDFYLEFWSIDCKLGISVDEIPPTYYRSEIAGGEAWGYPPGWEDGDFRIRSVVCSSQTDFDCDGISDNEDNCMATPNPDQLDTRPPQGNDIGNACDCESDFDCDGDVDGTDATSFKLYFGRNPLFYPCSEINPCRGDYYCDQDCDGTDAALFKEDFGRSSFNHPCPACVVGNWCGDYFSSSGCGSGGEFTTGERTVMSNDIERVYYVKLPQNYNSFTSYPLIFAFHGLGGDYTTWTEGYYDLQDVVAEEAILVYPNALLKNNVPQWDYDTDLTFFDDLYAELEANLCFDIRKVFAVGHSNGAGMSHTLGCKRGNILRAIGPVAGSLTDYEGLIGQVAVMQIHGSNDSIFPVESIKPTRDYWISINGCNEGIAEEGMAPTCEAYSGCDSGFPVQYCEHSGGHDWPDFASSAIWGFFQNLSPAVPSDQTGSGDIGDLGNGTISFKIHYPSDFVGLPYKLALALYPYDSTQPFTGSPLYFLNLDISVGDYMFGEVTEYDNVEISLLGVEYQGYTLAVVVYIEGSSYPMPSDGIDYIGLQNITLDSDTLEVTLPFELELVEW